MGSDKGLITSFTGSRTEFDALQVIQAQAQVQAQVQAQAPQVPALQVIPC